MIITFPINKLKSIKIINCIMADKSIFVRIVRLMNLGCALAMMVDAVFRMIDFQN